MRPTPVTFAGLPGLGRIVDRLAGGHCPVRTICSHSRKQLRHSKLTPCRSSGRIAFHLLALGLILVSVTGCRHTQPSFYPVGIYGVRGTNELAAVRNAGFNTVAGTAEKNYLDFADRVGLKVLAAPGTSAGPRFSADRAQKTVAQFDRHPALWAWYLIDEPDLHGVSPGDVRYAHLFVKRLGARKPTALVLYQGGESEHYANIADITMLDRYPIPWLPLANFPQHLRMARLAVPKGEPLIAVIQAFDWSYYPKLRPSDVPMRPPTYEELRCMTYCALARGVTGLFYYCFADGSWDQRDHPIVWNDLQKVVGEVQERLPLFQAEHLWWPFVHQFPGHPSGGFNSALESSVISTLVQVSQGNAAVPAGKYVISVNNTGAPLTYRITLPRPQSSNVPVLGENRTTPVIDGWLEDRFAPFAVHIYGPLL